LQSTHQVSTSIPLRSRFLLTARLLCANRQRKYRILPCHFKPHNSFHILLSVPTPVEDDATPFLLLLFSWARCTLYADRTKKDPLFVIIPGHDIVKFHMYRDSENNVSIFRLENITHQFLIPPLSYGIDPPPPFSAYFIL